MLDVFVSRPELRCYLTVNFSIECALFIFQSAIPQPTLPLYSGATVEGGKEQEPNPHAVHKYVHVCVLAVNFCNIRGAFRK